MYACDEFLTTAEDSRLAVVAVAVVFDWPSARGLTLGDNADQLGCSPSTLTRSIARFKTMAGLGSAGGVRFIRPGTGSIGEIGATELAARRQFVVTICSRSNYFSENQDRVPITADSDAAATTISENFLNFRSGIVLHCIIEIGTATCSTSFSPQRQFIQASLGPGSLDFAEEPFSAAASSFIPIKSLGLTPRFLN